MIILCNTLLPNDRAHAVPAVIGKLINPIPVVDKILEHGVAPRITIESADSNIVFRVS